MISKADFMRQHAAVRRLTESLCQPLMIEDYVIQGMEDVSPPKWHLAHTSWFFETFILIPHLPNYPRFNPLFEYLFNSYYQSLGQPYPRMRRGVLARPSVQAVYDYRAHVDQYLHKLLGNLNESEWQRLVNIFMLGLQHEQQHQELLLTDIKYNFFLDPHAPAYQSEQRTAFSHKQSTAEFAHVPGGIAEIGHEGETFSFDNELPRHACILKPYQIAKQLVTNGDYLSFIEAGGYTTPRWWLADGWEYILQNRLSAPLYWHKNQDAWQLFTLHGIIDLPLDQPVVHVSFYEADAYARFRGMRLPTEAEWEHYAASFAPKEGNFLEQNYFHPLPLTEQTAAVQQLFGDVWEWTSSAYAAYPGFAPLKGQLGEYNGKFMSNQMVLRGGSCVTPHTHFRKSYRNFFQPEKRWQFSGLRLAKTMPA